MMDDDQSFVLLEKRNLPELIGKLQCLPMAGTTKGTISQIANRDGACSLHARQPLMGNRGDAIKSRRPGQG